MGKHYIQIHGNLGRDPEMRYTPEGRAVTNLSVATNRVWTDANGVRQQQTTWFRVSFWGKLAEVVNTHFRSGQEIIVRGRLNSHPESGGPRLYQREDGSYGAQYEVVAQDFEFCGKSSDVVDSGGRPGTPAADDDDIPF